MSGFSKLATNALNIIENKELSKEELINFFNNINENSDIDDVEREALVSAVEKKMRIKFPNAAKKVLGSKSKKAQDLLTEIFNELKNNYDWSKNKVGSRVKVGGSMISGKEYVCWYLSYKNEHNFNSGFHFRQKDAESAPYLEVDLRKVGKDFDNTREVKIFPVEQKDDAVSLFKKYLDKVINENISSN